MVQNRHRIFSEISKSKTIKQRSNTTTTTLYLHDQDQNEANNEEEKQQRGKNAKGGMKETNLKEPKTNEGYNGKEIATKKDKQKGGGVGKKKEIEEEDEMNNMREKARKEEGWQHI